MNARRAIAIAIFVLFFLVGGVEAQAGGIIATPSPVYVGDQIAVVWGIAEPTGNDWISMHPAGAPNSNYTDWQYATPTVDGDGRSGVLYFTATTPGEFEFRLFRNGEHYVNSNTVRVVEREVPGPTSVPFGGGPLAQPTVGPSGAPPWETAQQSRVAGGVNLSIVCTNLGYPEVVNLDNTADGWRCKNGGTLFMLDWDSICRRVFGSEHQGVKISNAIDGWRCQQGGGSGGGNPTAVPQSRRQLPDDCSGVLVPHLQLGQIATVTSRGDNNNLRAGNGINEPIRGVVHTGQQLTVIGGPRCTNGYQWWQVQVDTSNTWWMAEADGQGYFLGNGNDNPPANPGGSGDSSCGNLSPRLTVGQQATVVGDGLNLRAGEGTSQQVEAILHKGAVVTVISGPRCADGYNWWQVQTQSSGTWWAAEGGITDYWLEPGNTVVQPTVVPVIPTQEGVRPSDTSQTEPTIDPCPPGVVLESRTILASYARSISGIPISCVEYIKSKDEYNDLFACFYANGWTSNANTGAADYISAVRQYGNGCPIVSTFQGSQMALEGLPTDGSLLMIWAPYCGPTGQAGHIAIFKGYSRNTVTVDDANWPANTPGGYPHYHPLSDVDRSCVTFIQVSGSSVIQTPDQPGIQPGQGIRSESTPATSIRWSTCVLCTPEAWVVFSLPHDGYDLSSWNVSFMGNEISALDRVLNQSTDQVTVHISSATIQQQIDAGHNSDLSNLSNWRFYYVGTM